MPHEQSFYIEALFYRYGMEISPSYGYFYCLALPLLRAGGKDEAMKRIPKTPVEFDYDLWTTEDGKCMVRMKSAGDITEVSREVMKILRAEEKQMRRSFTGETPEGEEDERADTILSLDYVSYEDGEDMISPWLADSVNIEDECITGMMLREFKKTLTRKQLDVFEKCVINGIPFREYAGEAGVSN